MNKASDIFSVIKRVISRGTVIFTALYFSLYFIVLISNDNGDGTSFAQAFLILLSSVIISASCEVFTVKSLSKIVKVLINYLTLLIAFFVVFVTAGKVRVNEPKDVFVTTVIFTFIYAIVFALTYLLKCWLFSSDKREKTEPHPTHQTKSEGSYINRFQ